MLKIYFLSTEIMPFSKTYSLSSFSKELSILLNNDKNIDIRLSQPKYGYFSDRRFILREVIRLKDMEFKFNNKEEKINIKSGFIPDSRVQVYFMEEEEFFQPVADLLYKSKNGRYFSNNHDKFSFFSKTVLCSLKKLFWAPEVVVCNDWQMSFVTLLGKNVFKNEEFYENIKYVHIIHSFDDNRKFDSESFKAVGLDVKDFESKDISVLIPSKAYFNSPISLNISPRLE